MFPNEKTIFPTLTRKKSLFIKIENNLHISRPLFCYGRFYGRCMGGLRPTPPVPLSPLYKGFSEQLTGEGMNQQKTTTDSHEPVAFRSHFRVILSASIEY